MIARGCALLLMTCLASGCSTIGGFAGAVAGFATGAVTANPAIGVATGVAVRAGVDAESKHVARNTRHAEHEAIASLVGDMRPGDTRLWNVKHRFPPSHVYGEVRVLRFIQTPLAPCKEVLFSVVERVHEENTRAWFTTTACREGEAWRWATAEPAVERWRNLQ